MRRLILMLALTLVPPTGVPDAAAEVRLLAALDVNICYNPQCLGTTAVPVLQGVTTKYKAIGPWTDHSASATVSGSGITATISSPKANFDNSSIDVALAATADAAPGERTVTLKNGLGGLIGSFRIEVLRKGAISSVDPPSPTSFFTQAVLLRQQAAWSHPRRSERLQVELPRTAERQGQLQPPPGVQASAG